MIKVMVVEDQEMARQALTAVISASADLDLCGEAENGKLACAMAPVVMPDVILMDIRMPEMNGIEATKSILEQNPRIQVIMLTTFDEDEYIVSSLQAGATGYLLKGTRAKDIIAAVKMVHTGHMHLGPTIAPKVLLRLQPLSAKNKTEILDYLSAKEQRLLCLLGQGRSDEELACDLGIQVEQVLLLQKNILGHLKLKDRTQAALWALHNFQDMVKP